MIANPTVQRVARIWWLPLLPAAVLMLIGFLRLLPETAHASESAYPLFASERLAWSDIISIYGRSSLAGHAFPYIVHHSLEYPVLTGMVFYLAGYAGYSPDVLPAFAVNYALLALCGLGLLALIARRPGTNPWILALSPVLVLYTGLNWDLLALLPGIGALLLFEQRRDVPAVVLLAISVWLKFFAVLWLPLVLAERVQRRDWRACGLILGLFALLSAAINLPFYRRDDYEWGLFFSFNRVRGVEMNAWTLITRQYTVSIDTVNLVSALGVGLSIVVVIAVQWRRKADLTLQGAALVLIWFFFLNKVYSPQYFIWLVPFLALLAAPLWLFFALSCADILYYIASFQILHTNFVLSQPQAGMLSAWEYDHILEPSMVARELLFLVLLAWLIATYFWRPRSARNSQSRAVAASG